MGDIRNMTEKNAYQEEQRKIELFSQALDGTLGPDSDERLESLLAEAESLLAEAGEIIGARSGAHGFGGDAL